MANAKTLPRFRQFTIYVLTFLIGISIVSIFHFDFAKSGATFLFSLIAILLAVAVNKLFKNYWLLIISLAIFSFFLGISYYSFFDFKTAPNLIYGQNLSLAGQIVDKPQTDYKKQQVFVKISAARLNNQNIRTMNNQTILVNLPHFPTVSFGDQIAFSGTIEKPGIIDNFDYGKYLKRYLIFGTVNLPQNILDNQVPLTWPQKIEKQLFEISISFENSLNRLLPEPHAALAAGLILGIKRNIPADFKNALQITGLTHIIALSGYNVTIIVAAISQILLGVLNKKQVFWFGSALIFLFVIMTGAASSIVRAAIFSLLILFGKTIGRQADLSNVLLLTALAMILVNPFVLFLDTGFQLSFLAFCGLVYVSPILNKILSREKYQKIPEMIKPALVETLSAQVAVFPLMMVVFGRISLIAPLSNVLIIWIVPIAMALTFFSGLFGVISYFLGKLTIILSWPILQYMVSVITGLAKLPFVSFVLSGKIVFLASIFLYMAILIWIIFSAKKLKISY